MTGDLVDFNLRLLDDACILVREFQRRGIPYAGPVAAHLRHVLEHHEALLLPPAPGVVDYDQRPREAALERNPELVQARLAALQASLRALAAEPAGAPTLHVRGLCGHAGQSTFEVGSTFGRELAFVASHAVHHFALMKPHCLQQGIDLADCLGADVGKAPATVAHERRVIPAPVAVAAAPERQEFPCSPSFAAA